MVKSLALEPSDALLRAAEKTGQPFSTCWSTSMDVPSKCNVTPSMMESPKRRSSPFCSWDFSPIEALVVLEMPSLEMRDVADVMVVSVAMVVDAEVMLDVFAVRCG